MSTPRTILAVSDFNIQPFADYLRHDADEPVCEVVVAPFGQVTPTLLEICSSDATPNYDAAFIWTRPESAVPGYEAALNYETVPDSSILPEVGRFATLVIDAAQRLKHVFVVGWSLPHFRRGLGIWSMRPEGSSRKLIEMNLELCEQLSQQPNVYVLDPGAWLAKSGPRAYNPKLWYLAKTPFSPEVFQSAALDVKAALRAIEGRSRKLLVVDLDNILWGGVVGETGWQNLAIGGHDSIGEAFADFQKALKALGQSGILLAIASKNDEGPALEAIDKHPEMILRRSNFAAWRINWSDKAQNIIDIAAELKLDLSSVVFIDDSPFERSRVRSAVPEVAVPEWPKDIFFYTSCLQDMSCFDKVRVTSEDRKRSDMYVTDRTRTDTRLVFQSIKDWLESLQLEVSVEKLSQANLARAAQLFNKTNQMNLSTRRLGERELLEWSTAAENELYVFRVLDKFGDYGLTGMVSVVTHADTAAIVDYLLSCRVMGRGVEELMLGVAIESARACGAKEIKADYLPTPKNAPCLSFFENNSKFRCEGGQSFLWRLSDAYALPAHIQVKRC